MKSRRYRSHYLLIGFMSLVAGMVLGLGLLAYITYLSYTAHAAAYTFDEPLSFSQMIKADKKPVKVIATMPKPTPTPVVTPDVRIAPIVDGLAPIVTNLQTNQPVVFLTIDDGAHKTPDELQMLKDNHLKATLFLARLFIDEDPGFFTGFAAAGNLIEDHTLNHNINMVQTSHEQQKAEICGMADYELQHYGRRPILYRPPGGTYNQLMQRAAADCGMKALVTWIAKANGGSMQYQIGDHLRPGDIVLMHFRPEFRQDLQAFIDAMKSQHLHTELLENWLP